MISSNFLILWIYFLDRPRSSRPVSALEGRAQLQPPPPPRGEVDQRYLNPRLAGIEPHPLPLTPPTLLWIPIPLPQPLNRQSLNFFLNTHNPDCLISISTVGPFELRTYKKAKPFHVFSLVFLPKLGTINMRYIK